jgi:hypothetical protein
LLGALDTDSVLHAPKFALTANQLTRSERASGPGAVEHRFRAQKRSVRRRTRFELFATVDTTSLESQRA